MKTYVCKKLYLNIFLQMKGFKPFAQREDKYDNTKKVWLYNDSQELQAAIAEYYS